MKFSKDEMEIINVFKHALVITFFVFVMMLAQFPGTGLLLFVLLFASGILFAWLSDKLVELLKITPCAPCLEGHCEQCLSETDDT